MKTTKRSFFRDNRKITGVNLHKKIASADWISMHHQNNANSAFEKFSKMFEHILNNTSPIKIGEPSSKSTKKSLSRENLNLINKKHWLFSIWKEQADVETYNSKKKSETIQTDYLEERVTIIHNNCSKVFSIQNNSANSLKQKENASIKTAKFLDFGSAKIF